MSEYISKDDACRHFEELQEKYIKRAEKVIKRAERVKEKIPDYYNRILVRMDEVIEAKSFILGMPAADVAPVVHGKWVDLRKGDGDYEFQCSNCKEIYGMPDEDITPLDIELFYCPHCGAKMDLEE